MVSRARAISALLPSSAAVSKPLPENQKFSSHELSEGDFESRHEFGFRCFQIRRPRVKLINALHQRKDFDGAAFGIHDPIFRDADLFIERLLLNAVAFPRSR